MEQEFKTSHMIFCTAFLMGTSLIGAFSHEPVEPIDQSMIYSGRLQKLYEQGFDASNPMRKGAVNLWGALKYFALGQTSKGAVAGSNGWLFTDEELTNHQNFDANLTASINEVSRVQKILDGQGITLVPVILPDKARVYHDQMKHVRSSRVEGRYDKLISGLIAKGVTPVSARIVMTENKSFGPTFMMHDTHWSPFGARLVADKVASQVHDLQIEKLDVVTTENGAERFEGDLLQYAPTGGLRALIGPSLQVIQRFQTRVEKGSDLFAQQTTDVVLIGTSFSAKSDWHFEGFLKQALSADVLNFAISGQGPFVPMWSYLKSEAFRTSPPKLVIWEIPERYTTQEIEK